MCDLSAINASCNATLFTESTLPEPIAHILFVVPPILGLLFTCLQWSQVQRIDVEAEEEEDEMCISDTDDEKRAEYKSEMARISTIIEEGAKTFLFAEYLWMAGYVVVFSGVIIGFYACIEDLYVGWGTMAAFIVGALTSVTSGYIGMAAATMSNARTTYSCWTQGVGAGLAVALKGGAIMGFGLCSLGVLVLYILVLIFRLDHLYGIDDLFAPKYMCEALAGFGLGGSSIALFGRVGGGIYTKAADVGADLSGKVDNGIEEDDPRNPACIADNVGDNVGDIAGMGADLFGSFAEATVAALVIAAGSVHACEDGCVPISHNFSALFFPVFVSSTGIIVGIITMLIVMILLPCLNSKADDEDLDERERYSGIELSLKLMLIISTVLETPVIIALGFSCLPNSFCLLGVSVKSWGCIAAILLGLWAGLAIGLVTEYFTSHTYTPVREVADSQVPSAATGIIFGLALGYKSCIIPVVLLTLVVVASTTLCGLYGIALAALGMLSTLTMGLAIDGFGPISDNAGGIAEMTKLPAKVRDMTDALDAAGNTTAAVGKGFAIGSAALVSLALFGAFKTRAKIPHVDVAEPWTFAGLLLGALMPYAFSAMTMRSVGKAANDMVQECRRQFPAILSGHAEPDYQKCIEISTKSALQEMILPGMLVILSPLALGLLFGKNATAGLLVGALVSGVQLAISMSNTGGAWDNSKKFIKAGGLDELSEANDLNSWENSKQTKPELEEAKKNSVIGDTVGDPLKDTSGPSLNILVKLSAITSLVFASIVAQTSNANGGPWWLKEE
jgi:inorganic pyrophosphatase